MEAMIFESHAHYDDEQFEEDRTELLNSMQENGIGTIINVGATFQSCTEVVQLAQEYPFIYAAVGVHPDEVGILDEEKFAYLREQCKRDKVVAVGEIGLDYYWDNAVSYTHLDVYKRQELLRCWRRGHFIRATRGFVTMKSSERTSHYLRKWDSNAIVFQLHGQEFSQTATRKSQTRQV